jgi:hypothetical protein
MSKFPGPGKQGATPAEPLANRRRTGGAPLSAKAAGATVFRFSRVAIGMEDGR